MEEKSYRVLDYFWRKVHRWHRRSLHDKALIIATVIAVIVTVFSICILDSENWMVPFIVAVVGCVWILLFTYANMRSCSEFPNS